MKCIDQNDATADHYKKEKLKKVKVCYGYKLRMGVGTGQDLYKVLNSPLV